MNIQKRKVTYLQTKKNTIGKIIEKQAQILYQKGSSRYE